MLTGMKIRTTVLPGGKTATGLVIPPEVVDELGSGRRPKVAVTINGHTYRSTVGVMDGQSLVPLSAEHRAAAGVAAGDEVDIDITLDAAPREIELPADLAEALGDSPAREFFDGLSFTYRKEWARWITDAKKAETRQARVAKAVVALREGRKTH
jgi:Bacteriocin-protection, YdeI or OmpD-Associated/Domain of unknown function (DUF1905)